MQTTIDVSVPDIGDFKDVPVIELLVAPGDTVRVDQGSSSVRCQSSGSFVACQCSSFQSPPSAIQTVT